MGDDELTLQFYHGALVDEDVDKLLEVRILSIFLSLLSPLSSLLYPLSSPLSLSLSLSLSNKQNNIQNDGDFLLQTRYEKGHAKTRLVIAIKTKEGVTRLNFFVRI